MTVFGKSERSCHKKLQSEGNTSGCNELCDYISGPPSRATCAETGPDVPCTCVSNFDHTSQEPLKFYMNYSVKSPLSPHDEMRTLSETHVQAILVCHPDNWLVIMAQVQDSHTYQRYPVEHVPNMLGCLQDRYIVLKKLALDTHALLLEYVPGDKTKGQVFLDRFNVRWSCIESKFAL